jgi:predicted dehydrogenase
METPQPKIRAIQVGCGSMSKHWLDSARTIPELEIVGLVDIFEEAARQRAAEQNFSDVVIGSNLTSVLEQCKPDVVFNCTTPEAHSATTIEALQHGCHVICEKPMADSLAHAQEMIEAARQAGKMVAIIQNRRYDANIRQIKNFLASNPIGPLTTVNSDFYIGAHFGNFRDHMKHVLLLDMAIHTFDSARFLIDADPVAVYCKEWNPTGSWYDQDASAIAIFEMSNGVVYTYRGSWCANGLPTTWESDWRLLGSEGTLTWNGGKEIAAQSVTGVEPGAFYGTYKSIEVPTYESSEKIGGHRGIIQEFVECIQTGKTPETNVQDNIKSLAMVLGAIESTETGKRVEIHY